LILIYIEALTETLSISTNSIEEADKTYFPTVEELVSSFTRSRLPEDSLYEKTAQQTVDELAIEKNGHFSNPNKSAPGRNIDSSQGRSPFHFKYAASNTIKDMPIVLDNIESDNTVSKVDLSDFRAESINQNTDSFGLDTSSKATTPFSPSPPCHHDPDSIASRLPSLVRLTSKQI
jgi:hypothetical protein